MASVEPRLTVIDAEIALLWKKYRATKGSIALVEIDKLLLERHVLVNGPEMGHSGDVASIAEWGSANLGDAA